MPSHYRALVTLAAGTGMRRGELLGLTLDRVAFDFATIRVDRELSRASRSDSVVFSAPKTDASTRTIPVAQVVLDAVRDHVTADGHHDSGLVFATETGSVLTISTIHFAWQHAARSIGTTATPHDLRHYFASVQIRAGQSIKVLQALLGHKSAVETWDTYGHLMGDEDDLSRSVIEIALAHPDRSTSTVSPDLKASSQVRRGARDEPACRPGSVSARLAAMRWATIHLGLPLPTASCGLPVSSGGPPSNAHARLRRTGTSS